MSNLRYSLVGYGRMGKLAEQVLEERGEHVSEIIDPKVLTSRDRRKYDWTDDSLKDADVAICFTSPDAGYETTKRILTSGVDAVVGTTKFYLNDDGTENKEMLDEFDRLAKENGCRMIKASNFSVGMNAFWKTLKPMAEMMKKQGYEPVILEAHHTGKEDVSGTAKTIGNILLEVYDSKSGLDFGKENTIWPDDFDNGLLNTPYDPAVDNKYADEIRELIKGAGDKIPIISVRHGDIPGTHKVCFVSKVDALGIDHIVSERKIFAIGAYDSADWLQDQEPGLYDIRDRL